MLRALEEENLHDIEMRIVPKNSSFEDGYYVRASGQVLTRTGGGQKLGAVLVMHKYVFLLVVF